MPTMFSIQMKRLYFLLLIPIILISQEQVSFRDKINNEIQSFSGRVGISAKSISTGDSIVIDGDSLFPTASIIKLPVLVELFFQFSEGKLSPDTPIPLLDSVKKPGSGILPFLHSGQTLKLIDIATLMIIVSDNTGTNYVIDQFGKKHDEKLDAVNNRMKSLGLQKTKLQNKLYSFATKMKTPEATRYGIGYTSPNDMLLLLEKIVNGKIVDRAASDQIISIMRGQQYIDMAPRYLPFIEDSTLWIANKTGSLDEVKNDVGIVSSSKGTYVYAIFCENSPELGEQIDNKATLTVAKISRMLFDYFLK
ncbi:MAG: serine hydrolase [Ignavibacteriae bacterium]|nr:serine hydrolase [Ignavibacteriota bacterium]